MSDKSCRICGEGPVLPKKRICRICKNKQTAEWRRNNKEYCKLYAHRKSNLERQRRYNSQHREQCLAYQQAYRRKKREEKETKNE